MKMGNIKQQKSPYTSLGALAKTQDIYLYMHKELGRVQH